MGKRPRKESNVALGNNLCILALIVPCLCYSGCSTVSGYPKSSQNDDTEITANARYFAENVRANEQAADDAKRGGLSKQEYRDAVVYGRLNVIDIRYFQFQRALTGTNNGVLTGADLTVLALNGLGATTGAASVKAALAAASAGVVGAKATINTDLFYQKTLPALITQMNATRQKQLATIKTGLAKSTDEYTLGEALNDVQNYYIAGTLPSAVEQVTSQAGASLADSGKTLQLVRDASFVNSAPKQTDLLDRVLKLTPAQALAAEKLMKPKLTERTAGLQQALKAQFPGLDTISDGETAQKFLKAWIVLDDRTAAYQKEWSDALDTSTK
jgi:hypothetical protein